MTGADFQGYATGLGSIAATIFAAASWWKTWRNGIQQEARDAEKISKLTQVQMDARETAEKLKLVAEAQAIVLLEVAARDAEALRLSDKLKGKAS